jgi:hypothetical protein
MIHLRKCNPSSRCMKLQNCIIPNMHAALATAIQFGPLPIHINKLLNTHVSPSCLQGFPEIPVLALVGDPKQLPATVISQEAVRCGYNRSLFERLQACGLPVHMLDTQYRMHPDISRFPSAQFYGGRLRDGPNVAHPQRGSLVASTSVFAQLGRCAVLDVHWGREEQPKGSTSYVNIAEAGAVMTLLTTLHKDIRAAQSAASSSGRGEGLPAEVRGRVSVGVISPYAGQVEYLLHCLEGSSGSAAGRAAGKGGSTSRTTGGVVTWGPVVVEVRSVDGFQVGPPPGLHGLGVHASRRSSAVMQAGVPVRSLIREHLFRRAPVACHSWQLLAPAFTSGLQGREQDIIILTTVRSNKTGAIGFLQVCQSSGSTSTGQLGGWHPSLC